MPRKPTRRDFFKSSAALGIAWWVSGNAALAQSKSPLEKLNFACIAVGGKGSTDTNSAASEGNIVALCDIDDQRLDKKAKELEQLFPAARKYHDYRQMLAELGDKIDAVTVSTPDHSHAPASILAMKMGKRFCQKPLTWSIAEARRMREVAAEKKVVTQMGNQGTALPGFREAVEVIRSGAIGTVKEVHVWTDRPIWPQGIGRFSDTPPVPSYVHWDLFLGPAPERPYHPGYHPFKWRGWLDFGTGALGDMACHTANMAVMALDLFDPVSVVAETSGIVDNESYPKESVIHFEFAERGNRPPVKLTWYDGGKSPPAELLQGERPKKSGMLLIGDLGTMYTPNDYGAVYVLLPKEKFKDMKRPDQTLARLPEHVRRNEGAHFKEFADACRTGSHTMSNFDYASRLTETVLLGVLAVRAGGKVVEWDVSGMKAKGLPELDVCINRHYRDGWTI